MGDSSRRKGSRLDGALTNGVGDFDFAADFVGFAVVEEDDNDCLSLADRRVVLAMVVCRRRLLEVKIVLDKDGADYMEPAGHSITASIPPC